MKINDFNAKKGWAIAKLNFKSLKLTIILLLIPFLGNAVSFFVQFIIEQAASVKLVSENNTIMGSVILVEITLIPIFLVSSNFYKTMRLNAKKKDYFIGALIVLAITAMAVNIAHTLIFYAVENPINNALHGSSGDLNQKTLWSLLEVFGFKGNGDFIGFFQMFGFIFFTSVAIFIVTSIQDYWLGWAVDILIVAVISVFSSIAFFRNYFWRPFFWLLIFGHPAVQLLFTIVGGLLLYLTYLPILKRKKI